MRAARAAPRSPASAARSRASPREDVIGDLVLLERRSGEAAAREQRLQTPENELESAREVRAPPLRQERFGLDGDLVQRGGRRVLHDTRVGENDCDSLEPAYDDQHR